MTVLLLALHDRAYLLAALNTAANIIAGLGAALSGWAIARSLTP